MPSIKGDTSQWRLAAGSPDRYAPKNVEEFAQGGSGEGSRNNDLYKAAQQMYANNWPFEEAVAKLLQPAINSGLSEREAMTAIRQGYKSDRVTEPCKPGERSKSKPKPTFKRIEVESKRLPDPIAEDPVKLFFSSCFESDDRISIDGADYRETTKNTPPGPGAAMTAETWFNTNQKGQTKLEVETGKSDAVYVRVNPMKSYDGKTDDDVAAFRHMLVEDDKLPKDKQYAAYLALGLPISAIIDSGNKSIHAWVRVDASNREEYDAKVELIYARLEALGVKPDEACKNPSRYSRLPGGRRIVLDQNGDPSFDQDGERKYNAQTLLRVNVPGAEWDQWLRDAEEVDDLPAWEELEDFTQRDIPEPPQLIKGVLRKGGKMVLGGPSKARKTWVMMDFALSVNAGKEWLGMETTPGKVLFLNFELSEYTFQKRWEFMLNKRGITQSNVTLWNLKGKACDIEQLADKIIKRVQRSGVKFDLIILDPTYKMLGGRDENQAGEMTEVMNHMDRIIAELQCALAFSAHFPKGNMGAREAMDRISGSGVFARDPEAILTMTPHEFNDKPDKGWDGIDRMVVDVALRDFPDRKPFTIKWDPPFMLLDEDASTRVAGSTGAPTKDPMRVVKQIVKVLPATKEKLESCIKKEDGEPMPWKTINKHIASGRKVKLIAPMQVMRDGVEQYVRFSDVPTESSGD